MNTAPLLSIGLNYYEHLGGPQPPLIHRWRQCLLFFACFTCSTVRAKCWHMRCGNPWKSWWQIAPTIVPQTGTRSCCAPSTSGGISSNASEQVMDMSLAVLAEQLWESLGWISQHAPTQGRICLQYQRSKSLNGVPLNPCIADWILTCFNSWLYTQFLALDANYRAWNVITSTEEWEPPPPPPPGGRCGLFC